MLISPIRTNSLNFKGIPESLGVENKLPKEQDYPSGYYLENDTRRADYTDKIEALCFTKDEELHPLLKRFLDEKKFIFEFEGQKPICGTIRDAIKSQIIRSDYIDYELYHTTSTEKTAKSIIENGFDPKYISRTNFGPGFYFAFSEGDALQYNSAKLKANCKGNCAYMNGAYYAAIRNNNILDNICKFIGLQSKTYPFGIYDTEISEKILNEYVRKSFIEDFGYDLAYGSDGQTTCIVAYNPNAISDIKMF